MCPRHPCYSSEEAAQCSNCDNQGAHIELDNATVAKWIDHNAIGYGAEERSILEAASHIIQRDNW